MLVGKCKWFDSKKGYGFITSNSHDYFVHFSDIETTREFKTLADGQEVEFEPGDNPRGICAKQVKVL